MERRAEDRFQVSSKIRVIVPEEPAQILDCTMSDISATGIRFQSPARMESGQIVAVEVDLRLILVEVRHCETRGLKFMIGVRRLHEIDKTVQLTDPVACVREMIGDLRGHITERGAADPAALATQALEQIMAREGDRELDPAAPQPRIITAPPPRAPAEPVLLDAELLEQSAAPKVEAKHQEHIIDVSVEPEEVPAAVDVVAPVAAAPVPIESPSLVEAVPVAGPEAQSVQATHETPEMAAPASTVEPPPQAAPPVFDVDAEMAAEREAEMAARMKRLQEIMFAEAPPDEVATARSSEAPPPEGAATPPVSPKEPTPQPATPSVIEMPVKGDLLEAIRSAEAEKPSEEAPSVKSNSWRIPLAIAAGLVLAAAITFTMFQRRSDANANVPPQPLVEIKEAHVEPTPAPAPPPPATTATPEPAKSTAIPGAVHHAQVKWTDASWVSIVIDDGKPFQGTLQKGDTRAIAFSKNATLWLGNASGVEIVLDGAKIAPMTGQVRLVELTPTGVKFPKMQAAKQAQE